MDQRARPRHPVRVAVTAAIGLLLLIAIGLVIETALGPKQKPNLSPPTAIPLPGESSASPSPMPTPRPALAGPLQVVQGRQLVNGVYLGYPHSMQGAVSAAVEFMTQIGSALDPDRAAAVLRLTADPSYSSGPKDFADGAISERKDLSLPPTGEVPAGASVVLEPAEYQAWPVTADQVTVLLLADDVITLQGLSTQTRVGVYPLRMHWAQGDWKILRPDPSTSYSFLSAQPGSAQAAADHWEELTP